MIPTEELSCNLDPYPPSFGGTDPMPRLTHQRRAEIEARTAFYGEAPWSLVHNLVADTIEQQLASANLSHLITVVMMQQEGGEHA